MSKNEDIERLGYCRKCLNETYGIHLRRRDVEIYIYPRACRKCGEIKNIVHRVRNASKWKLLFMRNLR